MARILSLLSLKRNTVEGESQIKMLVPEHSAMLHLAHRFQNLLIINLWQLQWIEGGREFKIVG